MRVNLYHSCIYHFTYNFFIILLKIIENRMKYLALRKMYPKDSFLKKIR